MLARRRDFLRHLTWLTAAGTGLLPARKTLARTPAHATPADDPMAVLVDLSLCIGCRLCEHACKSANGVDPGPVESYDDQSVFATKRRPAPDSLTVVNAWQPAPDNPPVYAKLNCVHCNYPACASACIVGALNKQPNGAVTYDAWKCIGCRYCMVACPFQLPAYEYESALTPQVRKCQFCHHRTSQGQLPACVEACPRQAMTYGRRSELLALADERIRRHPMTYETHVYGETEVGGTSWLYLSPVPFQQAGFLTLGPDAPPELTEKIQHGVFKYWATPIGIYSFLCAAYALTARRAKVQHNTPPTTRAAGVPPAPLPRSSILHPPSSSFHHHRHPAPINHKLLTPGVLALLAIVLVGAAFWVYRMVVGLAASTNLDQQRPWGLWIAMDVGSGIALAAGGFVAAAIFHVFHRERYHLLARSALLTALLGYSFYVPGLLADLGKWWKLPITMYPPCWQGNSVLFEVGMCVMIYLNVQYAELTPIIAERLLGESWFRRFPRLYRLTSFVKRALGRLMPALICLGVCLSCFHQSSLGNLMVIAPYKLHPLWWSPLAPLMFLLSAMMVGLPMVIFTILFASACLHREPEMDALTPLARRYVPVFLLLYLLVKVGDMLWRGSYTHLNGSAETWLFLAEMSLLVVPLAMFLSPTVCRTPRLLSAACLGVILGVVLNRLNVLVIAFHPPYVTKPYFPSLTEFMVSAGLVAALLLVYRLAVTYLPILEPRPKAIAVPAEPPMRPRSRSLAAAVTATVVLLVFAAASFGATTTAPTSRPGGWIPTTRPATRQMVMVPPTQPRSWGPDLVVMKELVNQYEPVPFDHKVHARMAEMWDGCVTCHHREPAPATQPAATLPADKVQEMASAVPACKSCHLPHAAEVQIGMPNLKGAYHRQCLNCHREWMHANACVICHKARDGPAVVAMAATRPVPTPDDITGRMHPPIPAPDTKAYVARVEPADGRNVLFRHKIHAETYGIRCATCHRHDNCQSCHDPRTAAANNGHGPRPMTIGRTWKETHQPCVACHEKDRCHDCHRRDDEPPAEPFSHASTGQTFDADHADLRCAQCHPSLKTHQVTCGDADCHPHSSPTFPTDLPGPRVPLPPRANSPTTQPLLTLQPGQRALLLKVRAGGGP